MKVPEIRSIDVVSLLRNNVEEGLNVHVYYVFHSSVYSSEQMTKDEYEEESAEEESIKSRNVWRAEADMRLFVGQMPPGAYHSSAVQRMFSCTVPCRGTEGHDACTLRARRI